MTTLKERIELHRTLKALQPTQDDGERCFALNEYGNQCEESAGHKNKHYITDRKTYFELPEGIADNDQNKKGS